VSQLLKYSSHFNNFISHTISIFSKSITLTPSSGGLIIPESFVNQVANLAMDPHLMPGFGGTQIYHTLMVKPVG
jgi:hypothetical protein